MKLVNTLFLSLSISLFVFSFLSAQITPDQLRSGEKSNQAAREQYLQKKKDNAQQHAQTSEKSTQETQTNQKPPMALTLANPQCATPEYNAYMRKMYNLPGNKEFEDAMQDMLENHMDEIMADLPASRRIPVVVHVIHNGEPLGTGANISDAQVQSQIQAMNDAFNRIMGTRYASTTNTGGYDYGTLAADSDIEFCFATVDPSGNPTTGINRVQGPLNAYDPGSFDGLVKPSTVWNPDYYFNIWVANLTDGPLSGLLGYAQFPDMSTLMGLGPFGGPAGTDGIVNDYRAFGSNEYGGSFPLFGNYQYGVTAIHEAGHFFGLRHIWGDTPVGDCGSDFVMDTPDQETNSSSCNGSTSCGSPDLIENYMDYGPDDCKNLFTNGQKARFDVVLAMSPRRGSLLTSMVCDGMAPPTPANDLCANAASIICAGNVMGTTIGSTQEGVPLATDGLICAGNPAGPGVWYSFVGTGDIVSISTDNIGTAYDTRLIVFSGMCGNLNCEAANDDGAQINVPFSSDIDIYAEMGKQYYIYVTGWNGDLGNYVLTVTCTPSGLTPPPNDSYTGAIPITCPSSTLGSTSMATPDPTIGGCVSPGGTASSAVWYQYTASALELVTLSTCNMANFDTRLAVVTGSNGFWECVTTNDDGPGCAGFTSLLSFITEPGVTYYIWIGGFSQGDAGDFTLDISCGPIPPGFHVSTAIPMACGDNVTGTTLNAVPVINSGSPGTTCDYFSLTAVAGQSPGKWHTMLGTGTSVTLNTCGLADYDSQITVYTGAPGNLTCLATNEDRLEDHFFFTPCNFPFFESSLAFYAAVGVQYYIFVNGWAGISQGNYAFDVVCGCSITDIEVGSDDVLFGYIGPTCFASDNLVSCFEINGTGLPLHPDNYEVIINGRSTSYAFFDYVNEEKVMICVEGIQARENADVEIRIGGACSFILEDAFNAPTACAAAQEGPNCRNLNLAINELGEAFVEVKELVQNDGLATPVYIEIRNDFGALVYPQRLHEATDVIVLEGMCQYLGRALKMTASNGGGACWSALTFKQGNGPFVKDRGPFYLYCYDKRVSDIEAYEESFGVPNSFNPCGSDVTAKFVADWVFPYDCDLTTDTAKIILREYETFDKFDRRGSAFDTIIVLRLPEITSTSIFCAEKDTTYCGIYDSYGPYIVVPSIDSLTGLPTGCDTIPLLDPETWEARQFDPKCGLQVHVDKWKFEDICNPQYKVVIEVKQTCWGDNPNPCVVLPPAAGPGTPNAFDSLSQGYWTCTYWVTDLDTLPPYAVCKEPFKKIPTTTHECAAHTYIPPICVLDDWSGIKQVKASIEGIGRWVMEAGDSCETEILEGGICYESHVQVKLPHSPDPYQVLYEVYDSCHNIDSVYCYIKVKDLTKPVAVADKGVTVSLSGKKVWVDAETFDEGSWDNCGVNLLLARRSDWYEACIDLCDSIDDCWISEHHDTIWKAYLETDKHVDEVEAHYAKTMEWLKNDNIPCGDLIYGAWQYDLMKYATLTCREHPYTVDDAYFYNLISKSYEVGSPCLPPRNLIINGDFETMDFTGWNQINLGDGGIVINDGTYIPPSPDGPLPPCNGSNGSVTWQTGPGLHTLYQDVWIPATSKKVTLSWIDRIRNHADIFSDPNQEFRVEIRDLNNNVLREVFSTDPGDPTLNDCVSREYDISEFKGQDIRIAFTQEDNLFFFNAHLDDVRVNTYDIDVYEQIGGGWSDAVPFSCEDACSPVTVEILVMDYWCNWSKAWTDVWVEDKTPVSVVKDVEDAEISCKTYKDRRYADPKGGIHPVSIEQIVELAKAGDDDAYDALDGIFGGYCKAWLDPYGNWVDKAGEEIECDIPFSDSTCECSSWYDLEQVYDEHLGYKWDSVYVDSCWYYERPDTFTKGIVIVNCEENVYCEQDVWCEFDHCGQGYLFRKFKIWQGCPPHGDRPDSLAAHIPDTIYRHQRIWVGNNCELEKKMFDKPGEAVVYACGIEYDPNGSGNVVGVAGPENTGSPTFKDVFDNDCRIVGIAHHDKVFKVVGGNYGCYKIVRTWYFADWCGKKPVEELWWKDRELVDFEWDQKIIVLDTIPPVCEIRSPAEFGDTLTITDCTFNLETDVSVSDMCGVIEYYWELQDIAGENHHTVAYGSGHLESELSATFDIVVEDLGPGSYKLKSRVRDECQNESYCDLPLTIISEKKPTPICISMLTAVLNPMDRDQDGVIDTAMATVWASEFNSSSTPACQDTALEYRLELVDGVDDDSWEEDADSLVVGCANFGSKLVRLWVISQPSGSVDYCDVALIVQTDFVGCIGPPNPDSPLKGDMELKSESQEVDRAGNVNVKTENRGIQNGFGEEVFKLYQNQPNPFIYETNIGFHLPESMAATMTVYDVAGKLLKVVEGDFVKGYNQISLKRSDLNTKGVLYYQLDTEKYTTTKKMVIIH